MITYAIIATAIAGGAGFLFFRSLKAWKQKEGEYEAAIDELESTVNDQSEELRQMENIIHELEEVNREANEKKRKLHSGSDSDNARRATDVMSKLARDDSQDGDETTSGGSFS